MARWTQVYSVFAMTSFVIAFVISCAHVEGPSGGPPDKSAPRVAGIYPAQNQIKVDQDFKAVIQFNEWINDRVNFKHAHISPPLETPLKLDAHGDKLTITSRDTLAPNTTYTISLSTSIEDLRGNNMTKPFSLTFSTGEILDSLKLQGFVQNAFSTAKISANTIVALYPLGEIRRKTPHLQYLNTEAEKNPTDSNIQLSEKAIDLEPHLILEPPMYKTGVDTQGYFEFQGLPQMKFRVMAFQDRNGNSKPELSEENVALLSYDVSLNNKQQPLNLSLTPMDTVGLSQISVVSYRDEQLYIKFNRSPKWPEASDTSKYVIYNMDSTWSTHPSKVFALPQSPGLILKTNGLKKDSTYTIYFPTLKDTLGRLVDSIEAKQSFIWNLDTTHAQMIYSEPRNKSVGIQPAQNVHLYFDRLTSGSDWQDQLMLTINGDTTEFSLKDSLANSIVLKPAIKPGSGAQVKIFKLISDTIFQRKNTDLTQDLSLDSIKKTKTNLSINSVTSNDGTLDDSPNRLDTNIIVNSKLLVSYTTWDPLKITQLQGTIPQCSHTTELRLFNNYSEYFTTCDDQNQFIFKSIEVSKYFLEGYHDLDSNNIRNPGRVHPFLAPEPYFKFADTLMLQRDSLNILDSLLKKETP